MIKFSRRGLGIAAAATMAATLIPASAAEAADSRLDQAIDNLVKAKALLEASSPGNANDQMQRQFARHVNRAIADIEKCIDQVEAAKQVTDGAMA